MSTSAVSYPCTPLGRKLSQVGDGGQGVTLFTKGGVLPSLVGLMQVCIISCIADPESARANVLKSTIANYTGKTRKGCPQWDIFIMVPKDVVHVYLQILEGLPVHLVAYEVAETMLDEKHKHYRKRNVGDARNASLALGVALRLKKLLVSDDDRCRITPFFNRRFNKNARKYFWTNQHYRSFANPTAFSQFRKHVSDMFTENKELAILGFSSYNRRRYWPGNSEKKSQLIFRNGYQHCAQLVMLNIQLLNKHSTTYLPIRMGEDTAFQYQLMEQGFMCLESSHLSHNSPTAAACASIARSIDNSKLENYSDRDIFWLKQFFNYDCVIRTGTKRKEKFYWKIRWCPDGIIDTMPNFAAADGKKTIIKKLEKCNKYLMQWQGIKITADLTKTQKKLLEKIQKDPRFTKKDNLKDEHFNFDEFLNRPFHDDGAGWQMMGELLHQMLIAGHIQQDKRTKANAIKKETTATKKKANVTKKEKTVTKEKSVTMKITKKRK